MAKTKAPTPKKKSGQRSVEVSPFFWRLLPAWNQPEWHKAEAWRKIVRSQPVAMLCKETLISNTIALDWKIDPRDSNQRDELKDEMDYYTQLLQHNGEIDWTSFLELLLQDFLDIPFGSGFELGYQDDDPNKRLLWYEHLDGSTLFPTPNADWPVGQYVREAYANVKQPIFFPRHAINRLYMSPRPEIKRKGWGMAPPEKVYLAIKMLSRGDTYYANLLLDVPEAGLLDLGDMEAGAAKKWVEGFRSTVNSVDGFKIPVLYEHTTPADFIPFGQPPGELLFDTVTTKYAALVCAGYGMSLSDIGFQVASSGGETLAGSIRQERKTRKTGLARIKKGVKYFIDRMIDSRLKFDWIDMDEELNVALGRARLANSTALNQLADAGMISEAEGRLQLIADGMMSIPMKETLDESEKRILDGNSPERPGTLGRPRPPSEGGRGEVVPKSILEGMDTYFGIDIWKSVVRKAIPYVKEYMLSVFDALGGNALDEWDREFGALLFEKSLPEDLNVSISHLNSVEVPEKLNSVLNLSETVERTIIYAIKEQITRKIKEEELDINDIMDDNTLEQGIISDVGTYLGEIKQSVIDLYKENTEND